MPARSRKRSGLASVAAIVTLRSWAATCATCATLATCAGIGGPPVAVVPNPLDAVHFVDFDAALQRDKRPMQFVPGPQPPAPGTIRTSETQLAPFFAP